MFSQVTTHSAGKSARNADMPTPTNRAIADVKVKSKRPERQMVSRAIVNRFTVFI